MAGIPQGQSSGPRFATGSSPNCAFARASRRAEAVADHPHSLPPELGFIAQRGVSQEQLAAAFGAPGGVRPLDALLREGIIEEEHYYRDLAQYLGCRYYSGAPLFAKTFDASKSLRCGVAPLEALDRGARAVIAPDAEAVPRLIEMTELGRLNPESFAVTSPQRFASLMRMRGAHAILDEALGRLPGEMSARRGMNGGQVVAAGLFAASAAAASAASLVAFNALVTAALWLLFSATIMMRSMAATADNAKLRPRTLSDDELPTYTIVAAVYREANIVRNLSGLSMLSTTRRASSTSKSSSRREIAKLCLS